VTGCLFRVGLQDGTTRLARGDTEHGPLELLAPELTVARLLADGAAALGHAVASAPGAGSARNLTVLAPLDRQEVWAAGVTYERSRDARIEESAEPTVYDRVYSSVRPELFFKSAGWRVRGPGAPIAVRADSPWNVPEPELALVVAADGGIAGHTIGNDVSSRTIEGENPLYLPQAKVYDGGCALGPAIVPVGQAGPPFAIRLVVLRGHTVLVDEDTTSARLQRTPDELVEHLFRAQAFPDGAVLLTGTGIVPAPPFTLLPGDRVTIDIAGLGRLENPVVEVGRPQRASR
jgi:2-dehydro-3-deoxy-D-arabinonate dehydratase